MAPRLTDEPSRWAVTAVMAAREGARAERYRKDLEESTAAEEWQQRLQLVRNALDTADNALTSYLERGARRRPQRATCPARLADVRATGGLARWS